MVYIVNTNLMGENKFYSILLFYCAFAFGSKVVTSFVLRQIEEPLDFLLGKPSEFKVFQIFLEYFLKWYLCKNLLF